MALTTEEQRVLSIIPHVTGLFSIGGSGTIIWTVLRDRKKWAKPYYRLLLAMSISDLFASVAFGLSTWPIPKGTDDVHAPLGNVGTCTAQGFFVQAGIASPMYNFMLSLYFILQVKYGMTEAQIRKRAEGIMHGVAIGFSLGTSFLCLGLGLFNESLLVSSPHVVSLDTAAAKILLITVPIAGTVVLDKCCSKGLPAVLQ